MIDRMHPFGSSFPGEEAGDPLYEPTREELKDQIAQLEMTNLKLRAVLAAYAGLLAAIEQTAREHRTNIDPDA